ncbi:MAG: glycosyltransferase family 4 protein [Acidobacteria bacterium]|nr:glycosyltransferase family 4 protein [Acidobacteriota bacterium]
MKVWLVTVAEPLPTDPGGQRLYRTGMLANLLSNRGHEVTWWTSTFNHMQKLQRASTDCDVSFNDILIKMLHGCGYARNISISRLLDHLQIAWSFRSHASVTRRPDIILCSYPTIELSREAVRYGLAQRVPVLLDIRDLWPDIIFDVLPLQLRRAGKAMLFWLSAQAQYALRKCTAVVGVSDAYLKWALHIAERGRSVHDGVFPLSYAIPEINPGNVKEASEKLAGLGVDPGRLLLWYVGTFGRTYDLVPVIEAARRIAESGNENAQFVITGTGDAEPQLRELARGLTNVVFTGWLGASEISWLRQNAAIGIQAYAAGAKQGLANKLFEYISAGLPVVSSLRGENETLIQEHGCGVTYKAGDPDDLLNKLVPLLSDANLRHEMGRRGKRLFEQYYSPQTIYEGLATHLERVAKDCSYIRRHEPVKSELSQTVFYH